MVTLARRARHVPFAPVVAVLFGIAAAVLVAAVPQWMFEASVVASGLPKVLGAASPPLGLIARFSAIAFGFAIVAFSVWACVAPLTAYLEARARARTPWRDVGYDIDGAAAGSDLSPPRRPIFAPDELGAPLMSDEAIAPTAILSDAPAPLTAEPMLTDPLSAEGAKDVNAPASTADSSIAALVKRLEEGLARRASPDPDPDDTGNRIKPSSHGWLVSEDLDASQPTRADNSGDLHQALGALRAATAR